MPYALSSSFLSSGFPAFTPSSSSFTQSLRQLQNPPSKGHTQPAMRDPKPTSTSATADSKADIAGADTLPLVLPPSSAPPAQVRTFLASLLQETNQTPAPQAQEIAAKWTVGTGRQLRSYPPMMFLDIFGRQDGWLLYREVRLAVHRERTRADWWYRNGTCASSSLSWVRCWA